MENLQLQFYAKTLAKSSEMNLIPSKINEIVEYLNSFGYLQGNYKVVSYNTGNLTSSKCFLNTDGSQLTLTTDTVYVLNADCTINSVLYKQGDQFLWNGTSFQHINSNKVSWKILSKNQYGQTISSILPISFLQGNESTKSELTNGSFYLDKEAGKLYIGSDFYVTNNPEHIKYSQNEENNPDTVNNVQDAFDTIFNAIDFNYDVPSQIQASISVSPENLVYGVLTEVTFKINETHGDYNLQITPEFTKVADGYELKRTLQDSQQFVVTLKSSQEEVLPVTLQAKAIFKKQCWVFFDKNKVSTCPTNMTYYTIGQDIKQTNKEDQYIYLLTPVYDTNYKFAAKSNANMTSSLELVAEISNLTKDSYNFAVKYYLYRTSELQKSETYIIKN